MHKIPPFASIVLFENSNFIIINKPPHISSLDERQVKTQSILSMARKYCQDAQLCHRLDKETSGIMIIAKNPETYRAISIHFEERKMNKVYHAIVDGVLQITGKKISLPLAITRNGLAKIDFKEGKKAETIFSTIKAWDKYTLLECKPITGRLHQIRIHLASQNFPITADVQYGGKVPKLSYIKRDFKTSKFEDEKGMIERVALHAYSLSFSLNDEDFLFEAPYPKDMDVLTKLLDKHN
jgi:23S rRNA pseudouridine955/2504/2580 synthase